MNDYLAAILFFLPAGISNMTPVLANKIPLLNRWNAPMDFGIKWRGKPIFGENKTLRGLLSGVIMGALTAMVISKLNANTVVTIEPVVAGALLGFGALMGDAIESFLKRQSGIAPGQSWFPYDQLDYIIGGLVMIYPFINIPFWAISTIFVTYFGLHLITAYFAFLLGLKPTPI